MPKYLTHASYTVEGLKGLLKDGGTKRREAVEQLAKSLGGTVEAFYYAFGDDDVIVIFDLPDNVSATIGSMVVSASGAAKAKITVLLTPEEIDQATKKSVDYLPPRGVMNFNMLNRNICLTEQGIIKLGLVRALLIILEVSKNIFLSHKIGMRIL